MTLYVTADSAEAEKRKHVLFGECVNTSFRSTYGTRLRYVGRWMRSAHDTVDCSLVHAKVVQKPAA